MPDGGPELTLITPGRVGRGAGGRPPRAGVGLTTAVILHPEAARARPRWGRTRPHHAGAGLTGDKAAITADRLALIAPGSDLSASARGCGSGPLVLRLVPALTWSARSPGNPRGRLPEVRPRGLPGDLADQGTFSRTGRRSRRSHRRAGRAPRPRPHPLSPRHHADPGPRVIVSVVKGPGRRGRDHHGRPRAPSPQWPPLARKAQCTYRCGAP